MTNSNRRLAAALASVVVAVSALGAQAPVAPGAPPQTPVGTGLVAGVVLDADTGRGIPGATVMLVGLRLTGGGGGQTTGRPVSVMTDSQGRFFFGSLSAGTIQVRSQSVGYTAVSSSRTAELADAARLTDIKLTLRRLGSISGRVVDDSGTAVVAVEMVLFRRTANQGRPPAWLPLMRTRTDDRGEYRFVAVSPSDYFICACLTPTIPFDGHLLATLAARPLDLLGAAGRAVSAGSDAVTLAPTLVTLPVTFYPGVTLASQAERVRLGAAEDKSGMDMTMTAVRAVRVSGRLVGATSSVNASQLRLRVVGDIPEAAAITQIVPMLVQPDGRFDFANVPPGQYILDVNVRPGTRGGGPSGAALAFVGARGQAMQPAPPSPQGRGGPVNPADAPLWAQGLISVGDRDVTGLVVSLNRSLTVLGRVVYSGSAPLPTGQTQQMVRLQLLSMDQGPQVRNYSAQTQADGSFQIAGVLPGRYALLVALAAPPWLTVKSVAAAGQDLTESAIEVAASDLDLTVTISDVTLGSVSGRVADPSGAQGTQPWVRAFPADRKYWREPFAAERRFRTTHAEPDGSFSLPRLPAGQYYLFVVPEGGIEWMDPVTLEAMARTADRVRVNDGDKVVVEVRR